MIGKRQCLLCLPCLPRHSLSCLFSSPASTERSVLYKHFHKAYRRQSKEIFVWLNYQYIISNKHTGCGHWKLVWQCLNCSHLWVWVGVAASPKPPEPHGAGSGSPLVLAALSSGPGRLSCNITALYCMLYCILYCVLYSFVLISVTAISIKLFNSLVTPRTQA